MTNRQWESLLAVVEGRSADTKSVGFIIDSPWLPGWAGISTLDYYSSDDIWLKTNLKAIGQFPEITFLPGFWSEYGMCTEPSAFGARSVWYESNLPHAGKVIRSDEDIDTLPQPNVACDGLLPFMINRLKLMEPAIRENGHSIKFAVTRGPLNIATFLMGTTEFLLLLAMNPDKAHELLEKITRFIEGWISYQKACFPSIEGILLLDDIVGFVGEEDCREYVVPYLKRCFSAIGSKIGFFHNDAFGLTCAPFLKEMGVNLFNFAFDHPIDQIRELAGAEVALIGNLPPRDVLAAGKPDEVYAATQKMMREAADHQRIIWSCGGGIPQNVSTENLRAFVKAVQDYK
ncbi:MAG TPA: uroporphyrinogen decarboxylase family protein [Prolixibacteraceae bacterium]|nr:uroporphyrinogen decarboxylase family protein [Prolixibacteraceae bacterium]